MGANNKEEKEIKSYLSKKKIALILLLSFISATLAYIFSELISYDGFWYIRNVVSGGDNAVSDLITFWKGYLVLDLRRVRFERTFILFVLNMTISAHFVFGFQRTFYWLFDKRWIIGIIVLLFFIVNKYNGDSFYCYNGYIQPNSGSGYTQPIIGVERPIRSDEWLVSSALSLHNRITEDSWNLTIAGVIKDPVSFISKVLLHTAGIEYAVSFDWFFSKIITLLLAIEFFMIVTHKRKLLSLVSALMVVFSSFYLWWSHPGLWYPFFGAIVCFNYFFEKDGWVKFVFGYLAAFFANSFIFALYPAWEVAMGYIGVVFLIYIVSHDFDRIKSMNKLGWISLVFSVLVLFAFLVSTYLARVAYIKGITATLYPGSRESSGGYAVNKLFFYVPGAFYAYQDNVNNSEYSSMITLFPIPLVMAVISVIKQKKKDIMLVGLLIVSAILFIYCTTAGMSLRIARLLMLSNSVPTRCVDILGFIQVVLFARCMTEYIDKQDKPSVKERLRRYVIGAIAACSFSLYTLHIVNQSFPEFLKVEQQYVSLFLLTLICFVIVTGNNVRSYRAILLILLGVSIFTGVFVRPINKGLDAIYSKPVAKEIASLQSEDPDAKWMTMETNVTQSYVYACGADVINVVHSLPDMDLWHQLDPEGKYDEVYNRYQHIWVSLTDSDTSFELLQEDTIKLNLSYKDMKIVGADYIFSNIPYDVDNEYVQLEQIYAEDGIFIYKTHYK